MATLTKAQLHSELAALRHNHELLKSKHESLTAECSALTAKLDMLTKPSRKVTQHAPRAKVFEFDPSINGDYKRAAGLAKQFGGVVRRMQA